MRRKDKADAAAKTHETPDSDIFASLQQKRVLFLTDEITSESANRICGQIMLLDFESQEDILLFINSEGGNVTDTMAIYDMMQAVRSDVSTICIGEAASGASILLSAGAAGKRYMLPNSRIMLHQPQGGVEGSTRDVEIEAKELGRLRELLTRIFEEHTGQSAEKLHLILDRDTYMSPEMTIEFGIVDKVIEKLPVL